MYLFLYSHSTGRWSIGHPGMFLGPLWRDRVTVSVCHVYIVNITSSLSKRLSRCLHSGGFIFPHKVWLYLVIVLRMSTIWFSDLSRDLY